jgi:hypothetical protein
VASDIASVTVVVAIQRRLQYLLDAPGKGMGMVGWKVHSFSSMSLFIWGEEVQGQGSEGKAW